MWQGGSEVVPLVLFLALAVLFGVLGVLFLARPARTAAFFADEDARKRLRERDARAIGAVFALGGVVLVALGVIRLVGLLSAG
ncbi:hypothetical protein [Leifsonia sp. SIMBA_070]|uniref:hypothetical protein n=1 Tax=Leifsonia sp. SIMBA_070 TaxID=3085810 RepID=UPI00397B7392